MSVLATTACLFRLGAILGDAERKGFACNLYSFVCVLPQSLLGLFWCRSYRYVRVACPCLCLEGVIIYLGSLGTYGGRKAETLVRLGALNPDDLTDFGRGPHMHRHMHNRFAL